MRGTNVDALKFEAGMIESSFISLALGKSQEFYPRYK